jgi:hypothetical protein
MIGATASAASAAIESLVTSSSPIGQALEGGSAASAAAGSSPGGVPATAAGGTSQDSIAISEEALGMFASSADGTTMSLGLSLATATETDGGAGSQQSDLLSLSLSVGTAVPANAGTGSGQTQERLAIQVDGASGKVTYLLPTGALPGSAAAAKEQSMIGDALATASADAMAGAFSISIRSVMVQSGSANSMASSDELSIDVNAQGALQATSSHRLIDMSNGVLTRQSDVSTLSVNDGQDGMVLAATVEDQMGMWAFRPGVGGGTTVAHLMQRASLQIGELAGGTTAADSGSSAATAALASMSAFETARRAEAKAQPSAPHGRAAAIDAVA